MSAQPAIPARWERDPTRQHQLRWWDGRRWTDWVGDAGQMRQSSLVQDQRRLRRLGLAISTALALFGCWSTFLVVGMGVSSPNGDGTSNQAGAVVVFIIGLLVGSAASIAFARWVFLRITRFSRGK